MDIEMSNVEGPAQPPPSQHVTPNLSSRADFGPRLEDPDKTLRPRPSRLKLSESDMSRAALYHPSYRRDERILKPAVSWDQEKPAPLRRFMDPPPLAPYVTPDKRFYPPEPDPFRRDPRYPKGTPAVDFRPIQVPPPPWIPAPGTFQPKSRKETQLGIQARAPAPSTTNPNVKVDPDLKSAFPPRPNMHPRTETTSTFSSVSMQRSGSNTSQQSGVGSRSEASASLSSETDSRHAKSRVSSMSTSATSELNEASAPQKKKRSRVLMTHVQQKHLGALWKLTKFPDAGQRQEMAEAIGLTARQVQVWFQNQRQKHRKQMQQVGGLEGDGHAKGLSADQEDRVSHWAASSGTGSSWSVVTPHSAYHPQPPYQPHIVHPGSHQHVPGTPMSMPLPISFAGPSAYQGGATAGSYSPNRPQLSLDNVPREFQPHSTPNNWGMWERRDAQEPPMSAASPVFGSPHLSPGGFGHGIHQPMSACLPPQNALYRRDGSTSDRPRPRKSSSYEHLRRSAASPPLPEISVPRYLPPSLARLAITSPVDKPAKLGSNILPLVKDETESEEPAEKANGRRSSSAGPEMTRKRSQSGGGVHLPSLKSMFG
ncbi:hypothetical protein EHS25_001303 [Saitozyma podzolica]|uniref:Homeobox domain-containing protein n=1 Tax=Saitozyma podzolica TaxID=1890683 RepID=A0A427YHZ4_9TREE|nr:hypothetical protein EHS25_001303 [Saitozyma podzolica]